MRKITITSKLRAGFWAASLLILSACNGDGVSDDTPLDKMHREALCVVSSEHFSLHDEAKRHVSHGLEASRDHFRLTSDSADFFEILVFTRGFYIEYSSKFHATSLENMCNKRITNGEFERGGMPNFDN